MSITVDRVGKRAKTMSVNEFKNVFEENKEAMLATRSQVLNNRFKVFDERGRQYKIVIRKDNLILKVMSESDPTRITKQQLLDRIIQLESEVKRIDFLEERINELQK